MAGDNSQRAVTGDRGRQRAVAWEKGGWKRRTAVAMAVKDWRGWICGRWGVGQRRQHNIQYLILLGLGMARGKLVGGKSVLTSLDKCKIQYSTLIFSLPSTWTPPKAVSQPSKAVLHANTNGVVLFLLWKAGSDGMLVWPAMPTIGRVMAGLRVHASNPPSEKTLAGAWAGGTGYGVNFSC